MRAQYAADPRRHRLEARLLPAIAAGASHLHLQANEIEALAAGLVAVHCGEYQFAVKLICDLVEGYVPLQKRKHTYKKHKIFTKKMAIMGLREWLGPCY